VISRRFSNSDIATLLKKFEKHLQCWKVGRSVGSMIYFEMGEKWAFLLESSVVSVGSVTLVLESDNWMITHYNDKIVDTSSISDFDLERLSLSFVGQRLLSLKFNQSSKECDIQFSDDLRAKLLNSTDSDLCTLTLPDGRIIGCSEQGFYSDGSFSEPHVRAYAAIDR
jgi:hypothetical protein